MMKKNKKGEFSLINLTLTLIVISFIIGLGMYILQTFRDNDNFLATNTVINETVGGFGNSTGQTVTLAPTPGFSLIVGTNSTNVICTNVTDGVLISSTNYTAYTNGTIISTAEFSKFTNASLLTQWKCTYTHLYGDDVYLGVNDTLIAIQEIPGWMIIMVVVTISGIILLLLFGLFPRAGGKIGGYERGEGAEGRGPFSFGGLGGGGGDGGTAEI